MADVVSEGHILTRETTELLVSGERAGFARRALGQTVVFETLCGLKVDVSIGMDGSLEPDVAWYEFGPGDCDACMRAFIAGIPHLRDLVTPV